jgi:hypothetical protein
VRGAAVGLGIAAGLSLAGASLAAWVRDVRVDDVAGVPIETVATTPGVEVAPLLLPVGIAAAAVAFGLAVRSRGIRSAVGAVLVLLGGLGTVLAAQGLLAALDLGGDVEPGAVAAVLAGPAIAVAGILGLRPGRARDQDAGGGLPARYDLDADDADAEWDLASAEDEDGPQR